MPVADLVLKNASVITMDGRRPSAGLVAIAGDRILLVGDEPAQAETGPQTRIVDCQGKTVVPGFIDAHCHLFSLVRRLLSVDLSPPTVGSIAGIKEAVRQRAGEVPPGTWISGAGFNEFYLAEKRCPNRRDLDEVASEHPVVLSHRSLHACVLNSLALSLAGITRETPDPPGGLIERDLDTGEPTGLLYEMLGRISAEVMPPLSRKELAQGVADADHYYLSCGITSIQEATVSNDLARWQTLRHLKESGSLHSRIYMMAGYRSWRQFAEAGMITGNGDEHLRLGGVKVMLSTATGRLQPDEPGLNRLALDCHRAGFQLAFHAIEQEMVEAAIAALEYVSTEHRLFGRRHRIEHCAECPPGLFQRLSALPVMVVTQPPFVHYNGDRYLATVATDLLPYLYRARSFLDAGAAVAASSDSPVVAASPLTGIYAAVTRRTDSGQELAPSERVTPLQALAMYTTGAASASFEEDIKGSIAEGKLADMVLLSDDPTRLPPEQIKDIRVEMTIIGGQVVWEGGGN